jgi:hypothetical protein
MYVPTTGWQGEQKPGASVGWPSIAAGCATRAAIHPVPAEVPVADGVAVGVA